MTKRPQEELEASNNGGSSPNKIVGSLDVDEEVKSGPLKLALTITPEFLKQIETLQQQHQQQRLLHDSISTPPGKTKPMSFPISKITIGEWTREAVNQQHFKAEIYFTWKTIVWECLLLDEATTRLNRIAMPWDGVLSLQPVYHPDDKTGILKVELSKPPTLWVETRQEAGSLQHSGYLDQIKLNHSASRNRIHTLHFAAGVLQENMMKLVSSDRFWSELIKFNFPTLEDLYFDDIAKNPPLNLALTIAPEVHKQIESLQQQRHVSISTPPGKTKPISFPISKITIGEWTCDAVNEQDLKAKVYFKSRKIMWECLEDVTTTETETTRRKSRKIEMQWGDVLSLKPWYHQYDRTGTLSVELRKPPTFYIEIPQAGKPTQWEQSDQDFTLNHSASRNRRHTLHFAPGVLQENMKNLVSGDRFWSELVNVQFPTLEDLYFDDTSYGNSMNNKMAPQFHGNHESSNN
ncbi:hypothetical protein HA466_0206900 [Hirschfeldia incana]|nr:hypothetical protein HA466_0206900 [Hirschfeldia incana]